MSRPDGGNHNNDAMNIYPYPGWVRINLAQWTTFLETVNWTRDGWGNGKAYANAKTGVRIAMELDNGEVWVAPYFSRIPENIELCQVL